MSERIKYQRTHILLLVISFSISALILFLLNSYNSPFDREKASQLKVSPDLYNLHGIASQLIEDDRGNIIGDAFLYRKDNDLHIVFSATDEKKIESTFIRLSDNLAPVTKFETIAQSHDYSSKDLSHQSMNRVIVPLAVLDLNTHLISAIRTSDDVTVGRYYDGTVTFQPQIIQSIIH